MDSGEHRPSGTPAQEAGRLLAFPTPPGADPRVRRLRLAADAYRIVAEALEMQIRAIEAGAEVSDLAERGAELAAEAGRMRL